MFTSIFSLSFRVDVSISLFGSIYDVMVYLPAFTIKNLLNVGNFLAYIDVMGWISLDFNQWILMLKPCYATGSRQTSTTCTTTTQ